MKEKSTKDPMSKTPGIVLPDVGDQPKSHTLQIRDEDSLPRCGVSIQENTCFATLLKTHSPNHLCGVGIWWDIDERGIRKKKTLTSSSALFAPILLIVLACSDAMGTA